MNTINMIGMLIAFLALAVAAIIVAVNRYNVKKTINRLSRMVDSAIDGSFTESTYDESKLSALEVQLNQYLSGCAISSKNLNAEKDKIKSLISDISHQTKTPIANILLYSQLLSENKLPDDCEICVQQISSQTEKLNFLIGALIKTSRLETGIITISPVVNQVKELLSSVTERIAPMARNKNITIKAQADDGIACFDMKWTAEALYNIVDNAVKYTPYGGSVTINSMPYELFHRINITDNGIGICENEHSRIFTRFYRSQAVSQYEGVGIGLFLAREIISVQGGYIKVDSREGKGSTFSVFLPIVK